MTVYQISEKLQNALRGDATAVAEVWRAISRREVSPVDAMAWLEAVAQQVVEKVLDADLTSSNRRAEAALKAIGFYGRIDRDRRLREEISFVEQGLSGRPRSRAEFVETVRLFTADLDGLPLEKAVKKVDRLRKK